MNVSELPNYVYLLGKPVEGGSFSFNRLSDASGKRALLIWTTEEAANRWAENNTRSVGFSNLPTQLLLKTMVSKDYCDYLICNPTIKSEEYKSDSFVMEQIPEDQLLDLYNFAVAWPVLNEAFRQLGLEEKGREILRLKFQGRPVPKFKEAIQFGAETMMELKQFLDLPTADLIQQELFERAWEENRVHLPPNTPMSRAVLVKRVLEQHPELNFKEGMEYASSLFTTQISTLKRDKDFDAVCECSEAGLKEINAIPLVIEEALKCLNSMDSATPLEALKRGSENFKELTEKVEAMPEPMKVALGLCPPSEKCDRCHETHWDFESLSPNRKSATWVCGYCGKKHIILADRACASEAGRQPIPKQVLNDVWRRDLGKCVQCGSQENLEFDHIIPVSRGGANTARNLQLLCQVCNREKAAKAPGE